MQYIELKEFNYDKTILENGIKVISQTLPHVQSFSLGIWVNVGSFDETINNNGITHFIEHCVFKGSRKRSAKQIAFSLESRGGYINAFTTKEYTCFYARGLKEDLPLAIDVLSDLVLNPRFRENDLEKEKNVIIDEILSYQDNPEDNIFEILEKELYIDNPLGYPIVGTIPIVEKFQPKVLFDFTSKYFTSEKILVTCVGNIEHSKLRQLAEKCFGNLKKQKSHSVRKYPQLKNINKQKLVERDVNQVYLCLGKKSIGTDNKCKTIQNAINVILGDGASSRLFLNVREKHGIAYNIYSFINWYLGASTFGVFAATTLKNQNKLSDLIFKDFEELQNKPLKQTELNIVKKHLKGSLLLSIENPITRLGSYAQSEMYFNEFIPISKTLEEIEALTSEDIQKFALTLLAHEDFTQVKILPNNNKNGIIK